MMVPIIKAWTPSIDFLGITFNSENMLDQRQIGTTANSNGDWIDHGETICETKRGALDKGGEFVAHRKYKVLEVPQKFK